MEKGGWLGMEGGGGKVEKVEGGGWRSGGWRVEDGGRGEGVTGGRRKDGGQGGWC